MEKINDAYVLRHGVTPHFKQNYLMLSDIHYDSVYCQRKLLKKVLDEAVETDAKIMIFGDLFDVMGGKFDKRASKDEIRPEYSTSKYFTQIVEDAAAFFIPYKDNVIFVSDGNHETSIQNRNEISLLDNFCFMLNLKGGDVLRGKYSGFIRFMFDMNNSNRSSKLMYYTHGSGGAAPVTKGAIKTNRRQDYALADFYVSGHIHTEYELPRTQIRLNQANVASIEKVYHWQLGCFKNDFLSGGWADHKEFAPPNLGGRWLQFYYNRGVNTRVSWRSWIAD